MIDTTDLEIVRRASQEVRTIVGDYFNSTQYVAACERWKNRRDAYLCRPPANVPVWKSRLYMPTFWLGCTALMAQFKQTHQSDPFLFVSLADDSKPNDEARQLVQLAQADLNYDLYISDFIGKKIKMDFFVSVFGTACAREYLRVMPTHNARTAPVVDESGNVTGTEDASEYGVKEMTCTDVVHPLNFGHDPKVSDFTESDWGATRILLHLSDVVSMKGLPDYYQPGVEEVLQKMNESSFGGYVAGSSTYYQDDDTDPLSMRRRQIVAWEYSGPLWFRGNEGDPTLYYCLYLPDLDVFLRIGKSPFTRHPFWKMQTHPLPHDPYGIGPNDMLRPVNLWENNTVNQYVDYMNSALRYMYKVFPGHIAGGVESLIRGLPGGLVEAAAPEVWDKMIEPVRMQNQSIPPLQDVLNLIYKYKEEVGPSSNLRGKGNNQLTDTATGISLMASREDDATAAMQEGIDRGIQNGMMIKFEMMTRYMRQPRTVKIGDNSELVTHYPFELPWAGGEFSFKIKRRLADVEAQQRMNFLRLLDGLDKAYQAKGIQLPLEVITDTYRDVGRGLQIDGIDSRLKPAYDAIEQAKKAAEQQPQGASEGAPPQGGGGGVGAIPSEDLGALMASVGGGQGAGLALA